MSEHARPTLLGIKGVHDPIAGGDRSLHCRRSILGDRRQPIGEDP